MPFCTSCGKEYPKGHKFCEYCGAPVGSPPATPAPPPPSPPPAPETPPAPEPPSGSPASPSGAAPEPVPSSVPVLVVGSGFPQAPVHKNLKIVIAVVAVLVVIAGIWFVVLPGPGGSTGPGIPGIVAPITTTLPATAVPTTAITVTTIVPTPSPNPFPDAFSLKEWYNYNEGKYASKATVYRYWINGTYQWHNDADNRYYTQRPKAGNKYLFVYVNIVNLGTSAYPYPKSNRISVHYDGIIYSVDTSHYLPDKADDREATAIEVEEIQQQSDFFNSERVEDYGYSHGTTSDFIYPGQSNAIDGYLIYEVSDSLTPDATYVEIVFDGEDRAVWKLA